MVIEIVDLLINSMVDLSSSLCKRLPEGILNMVGSIASHLLSNTVGDQFTRLHHPRVPHQLDPSGAKSAMQITQVGSNFASTPGMSHVESTLKNLCWFGRYPLVN